MISYETAVKIKEAGFPGSQHWNFMNGIYCDDDGDAVPTLSELIEACGGEFHCLERYSGGERWRCVKWISQIYKCEDGIARKGCLWEGKSWGFTPEEAVANLYLELHK